MADYRVNIKGKLVRDDGWRQDLGLLTRGQAWWEVALPPCPDCGGDLVWFEAGYVAGTRKCLGTSLGVNQFGTNDYDLQGGCGGLFDVGADQDEEGHVVVRRLRLYGG